MVSCPEKAGRAVDGSGQYEARDGLARIVLDAAGGAMLAPLRRRIADALEAAREDDAIRVVTVVPGAHGFPDAAEFHDDPDLQDAPDHAALAALIDAYPKPVVVALTGHVQASSLGFALACHYRVAATDVRLSFPEHRLGLVPVGGAVQRLARLAGAGPALSMLLTGRPIGADAARKSGLIDMATGADPAAMAGAFARALIEEGAPPRPASGASRGIENGAIFLQTTAAWRAKASGLALRIIDCVEAAALLPWPEALAYEDAAVEDAARSVEARALVHLARAERNLRAPAWLSGVRRRAVRRIGIVGAGARGTGLALSALKAGFAVTLVDRARDALEDAVLSVIEHFDGEEAAGRLKRGGAEVAIGRLTGRTTLEGLDLAEAVVDCTGGGEDARTSLVMDLDGAMAAGAVLILSTPDADVDRLAARTSRAEDVIALRLHATADQRRGAEFAPGVETGKTAAATAWWLARRLGKLPVEVRGGAIGRALASARDRAADRLVLNGADIAEVDAAARAIGFPEGPFEARDRRGLLAGAAGAVEASLARVGRTGRDAGQGFYDWPEDGANQNGAGQDGGGPRPSVIVAESLSEARQAAGVEPKAFKGRDLRRALIAALANAAADLIADGVAVRPRDVDLVAVHGLGLARSSGGPTIMADEIGIGVMASLLEKLSTLGPDVWRPSPLFADLVKTGRRFADLDRTGGGAAG